jgi:hypothetical protein
VSTAAVHAAEGLSAEEKRRLWLVMREVERAAAGATTQLFTSDDFAAALAELGLPQYVQVSRRVRHGMHLPWLALLLPSSSASCQHIHLRTCMTLRPFR